MSQSSISITSEHFGLDSSGEVWGRVVEKLDGLIPGTESSADLIAEVAIEEGTK